MIAMYVGTYTDGASEGIYRLELDRTKSRLSAPVLVARATNPTFLAWHARHGMLYAVNEIATYGAEGAGVLQAYRVSADGSLVLVNETSTGGAGACFVSLHPAGTHAFVANYGAGSVAVVPLRADGRVATVTAVVQHAGMGPHPVRQTKAHAHAMRSAPGGEFVVAADLGADRLLVSRFDGVRGTMAPLGSPVVASAPGAGPRHLAWHPSGDSLYVINELDSTIATYAWDAANGTLTLRQIVPTLPEGWAGENTTAEIVVHPSGRFVYGSNRGHDSIALFGVQADRTLAPLGVWGSGGKTPRSFAVDPSGTCLIAANQDSDSIVLFQIDPITGALVDTTVRASVPTPAFVCMVTALHQA